MSALIKVRGNTYILPGSVNIGVVVNGDRCVLIDTGLDKSVAKRCLRAVETDGLSVSAIINTHAHADHCGGNAHIQSVTGAMAYASRFEGAILTNPSLEALYLCGATPPKPFASKLIMAEPTIELTPLEPGKHEIEGLAFELIPLPGHSPGQFGVLTPDGAMFFGDALVPEYVFEKYKLPFITDVSHALESIGVIEAMENAVFVGAHTGVVDDIRALCKANREGIENGLDVVYGLLGGAILREEVLRKLFEKYEISLNPIQWALMLTCVSACLYSLHERGRVELVLENGAALWKRLADQNPPPG